MTTAASKGWHARVAWIIVAVLFIGILADVARHPMSHTTMPTYRLAATQWWQGLDVYSDRQHDGFLYFPQAAMTFSLFNFSGFTGDLIWRAFTFGFFLYALVRLNKFFLHAGKDAGKSFLILCLLAVPSSMASLRNAQFDLPMSALIVLMAVEVGSARWTAAAFWICVAVALKPLAVVPLLLFGALYAKLLPRLLIGILIVIALPFLHWNPSFVAHEYGRCFETLAQASKADEPRYSDLGALLSKAHIDLPMTVKTGLRVVFALVYFGLGLVAVKKLGRVEAAWTVGALAADYLMLFNPRTETCSYVVLGPFIASLALFFSAKRPALAWALGFGAICLACDGFPKIETGSFVFSIHDLTDRWLKPLVALLFLPALVVFVFGRKVARG